MRKAFLLVGVLGLALCITYLLLHKNPDAEKIELKDKPLTVGTKSSAFNKSFELVLNDYYSLSDAFVESDSALIGAALQKLNNSLDSLHFNQLKADTAIIQTAQSLVLSIKAEISGLDGEKGMEQKKREFNMVTDELYSLIRTVRYEGNTIYHMRCTTAFPDSSEVYWLSSENKVVNPYLGKHHPLYKDKMLGSGELSDSIHFTAPVSE